MRWAWPARLAGAAALVFAAAAVASEPPIKPWTGGPTPPLALRGLDGSAVDLARLRGRVVVVNFWATWCEPCIAEMPSLDRLRGMMQGRPFELLTVNFGESPEKASAFVAKQRLASPVLLDPGKKAADAWKVRGLPMTFVVDARGRVRYWTFGEREWTEGEALRLVEQLIGEAKRAGS